MKWIRTMVCALGMLACVSLSAFAAEYGEPNITTKTTMKELRENPSIKGSGYYTYCNEWIEGSTQYDDTPIEGYVSYAAAEDAAEGMNLVIENYNKGVQITWQVYTPEEIAEKLNEKVAEGMINISMNTAPYFEDGKAEGNVMIVNESINNYPQQVEFIRNDTGEQVYQSNAIPVGSKIERAALDVELPAGTYECTAMFHNLDPVSGEVIGTAGAIINITIKN